MKKLKLQMETLAVESFAADDEASTVQAHELFATRPAACDPFSVPPRCA